MCVCVCVCACVHVCVCMCVCEDRGMKVKDACCPEDSVFACTLQLLYRMAT